VPLARTPAEQFDDFVLDAVEELEERWGEQLAPVEFAVEDVPPPDVLEALADGDPVPLSRLLPASGSGPDALPPRVVLYRRPIEARSVDPLDLADLVHDVVAHEISRHLGIDPDSL
jgi:predicted Zn-dependent protease with MMP-like domain